MDCDPTRVNEMIVGLGDVDVLGVDETVGLLRVHVRFEVRARFASLGGRCGTVRLLLRDVTERLLLIFVTVRCYSGHHGAL